MIDIDSTPLWLANLPPWVIELRAGQLETAQAIANDFREGYKYVVLDAPVGSGKTLVAEMVRQELGARALYVCTTKTLQDQVEADFDCSVIKGRSNYPTRLVAERRCDECEHAFSKICSLCEVFDRDGNRVTGSCPYAVAKLRALSDSFAVANTSYFLTECNYGPKMFSKRDLVIVDECDMLEDELMSMAEIRISNARQRRYKIPRPEKITVQESWVDWALVQSARLNKFGLRDLDAAKTNCDTKAIKQAEQLLDMAVKLMKLANEAGDNWIYDPADDGTIVFKPITVESYGQPMVFNHGKKFLLMSGTVIEPTTLAESLGIEAGEFSFHQMPYAFDIERRPIYISPVADMTYKNKAVAVPKAAAEVARIVTEKPGQRILVHSVSYELTAAICRVLEPLGRTVTYSSSMDRQAALERYKATADAVMVAPSFERGVDLRGDLCSCIIIPKIPFPHLGDKQISTRMYSSWAGRLWYQVATVRSLVQMMGRGMRAADDYCEVWILDNQFLSNVWKNSKKLLPEYVRRSIKWQGR